MWKECAIVGSVSCLFMDCLHKEMTSTNRKLCDLWPLVAYHDFSRFCGCNIEPSAVRFRLKTLKKNKLEIAEFQPYRPIHTSTLTTKLLISTSALQVPHFVVGVKYHPNKGTLLSSVSSRSARTKLKLPAFFRRFSLTKQHQERIVPGSNV